MLEGLRSVRWESLTHAYGRATDTPRWLRNLAEGGNAAREQAITQLASSLSHQGTRYTATPRAVPFLIELLGVPSVERRDEILRLIAECTVGLTEEYFDHAFDIDEEVRVLTEKGHAPEAGLIRHIYDAARAGVPVYVGLLGDASAQVRMYAAFMLAWFKEEPEQARAVLLSRIEREEDPWARASAVWTLGILAERDGDSGVLQTLRRCSAMDEPFLVRFAAAVGLLRAACEADSEPAQSFLIEVLSDPTPARGITIPQFPWPVSEIHRLAQLLWKRVPVENRGYVILAMAESLSRLDGSEHAGSEAEGYLRDADVQDVAIQLLEYAFDRVRWEQDEKGRHIRLESRRPEELSEEQRCALLAVVRCDKAFRYANIKRVLWECGLPGERPELASFVEGYHANI